jgi:hypothetical protein
MEASHAAQLANPQRGCVLKQPDAIKSKQSRLVLWPLDKSLRAQKNTAYLVGWLTLIAAIYTFYRHHNIDRVLADLLPITIAVTVIVGGWVIYTDVDENTRWPRSVRARVKGTLLVIAVFVPVLSIGFYVLKVLFTDLFDWTRFFLIEQAFGLAQLRVILALIALIAGTVLYAFRSQFRACYGITEIVVGVLVALTKASDKSTGVDNLQGVQVSSTFAVAILTASVYLIVRGLDSLAEGSKPGNDPIIAAVVLRLRHLGYLRSEPSNSSNQLV